MLEFIRESFSAIRVLTSVASIIAIFLNCFYLYYLFKGKKDGKTLTQYVGKFFSKKSGIILCEIVMVCGILLSPPIYSNFENTTIGSFFEKETYSEKYYVYIRRDNSNAKAYKVKADILKSDYGYPTYTDEGEETVAIQGNGYFIKKIYWESGGYITFMDEYEELYDGINSTRIYPNRETSCEDVKGDTYYIMLTQEKAK